MSPIYSPPANIAPAGSGSVWGMTTYLPTPSISAANLLNLARIYIPAFCTITGIQIANGSPVSGNVKSALYDSAGNLLASSGSVAQTGTFASQLVPFSAPVPITPGDYILGLMPDNATGQFETGSPINAVATPSQGAFTVPATVTPPTATTRFYIITMATY